MAPYHGLTTAHSSSAAAASRGPSLLRGEHAAVCPARVAAAAAVGSSPAAAADASAAAAAAADARPTTTRRPCPSSARPDALPTTTTTTTTSRRAALAGAAAAASLALLTPAQPAAAVQGLTAGRIPGLGTAADEFGYVEYRRPEGKSGGHGVGWSEMPRYSFRVPTGYEEAAVSIADLGGTEIDCKFLSADGMVVLSVIVAPVLRFLDLGYNADIRLPDVGPPEKLIAGFYPELFGKTMEEGDLLAPAEVVTRRPRNGGREMPYYRYELAKKRRVAMTATGNRVFILSLVPKGSVGARKHGGELQRIAESFDVDAAAVKPL